MEDVVTVASPARARTATLVIVGPQDRLGEAASCLTAIDEAGGVRGVLISTGSSAALPMPAETDIAAIAGLRPEHLDNAIAALRLSSLPTVIWWRGGEPERFDAVATLADRVVLDAEDTVPLWGRAAALFERTAITDVRWARLTRWRAVMAHFFDLPQVRDAAPALRRLTVAGDDSAQCRLFVGWLDASLGWNGDVLPELTPAATGAPMESVRLEGDGAPQLSIRLLPNGACLATEARVTGQTLASRVLSLGDQALSSLLLQELRVRSRDIAFERAVAHVLRATG
jgi:glucose-6-phosphate dehydrogenase assembly protein OpcA